MAIFVFVNVTIMKDTLLYSAKQGFTGLFVFEQLLRPIKLWRKKSPDLVYHDPISRLWSFENIIYTTNGQNHPQCDIMSIFHSDVVTFQPIYWSFGPSRTDEVQIMLD